MKIERTVPSHGEGSKDQKIKRSEDPRMTVQISPDWMKYIFPKGFVGLDGCSLTVVDVDTNLGTFTVAFIPETLKRTTFNFKRVGDRVNVELDAQTVAV